MPLSTGNGPSADAALAAAVQSNAYTYAAQFTVTLPGVGLLDLTGNVVACDFQESDTSSYPDDLTDKSGITNTAGSVTLSGYATVGGASVSMIRLFNPDDAASPVYRQPVAGAPLTVSTGVFVNGAPDLVPRPGYVTTVETDVSSGTVVVNWEDVPPGWDNLPAIEAVMTPPPFNAGLTNEFVIDRIARAASGGAVSSWPAQRANCVLAVGLRTSLWPEVGVLSGTLNQPFPTFAPGPYGSGLTSSNNNQYSGSGYSNPQYSLAAGIGASTTVFVEFFVSNLTATSPLNSVNLFSSGGGVNNVYVTVTTAGVSVSVNNGPQFTLAAAIDRGVHYVAAKIALPAGGGTTANVTVYLDGQSRSGTATLTDPFQAGAAYQLNSANLGLGAGVYAGVQVATGAQTPNNTFTPLLVCDPSLNSLLAVPAIDSGTSAYDELQTVAESEGGYIAFRQGVLRFLNRRSIISQAATRPVTAASSLKSVASSTTGQSTLYDSVTVDFTGYTWASSSSMVFTPAQAWKVPARSTRTWTQSFANGVTVAQVDQSITYRTVNVGVPGSGNSVLRASLDPNGVNEIPDTTTVFGAASAVTPSQVRISVTNNSTRNVWLVSPANYTDVPVGTPSLWINGLTVTAANPTTMTVSTGTTESTYTMPANQYRQVQDDSLAYANDLLTMLSAPKVSYGSVDVVPDPSITCPDRITLDIPVDGGVTSLDAMVWGVDFSASFESGQESWDMTLDVRSVASPGAWILGTGVLGTSTYIY